MKEITPEVFQNMMSALPLFGFGLALFFTAFVSVVGTGFTLLPLPNVRYRNSEDPEPTRPDMKWKIAGVLMATAVVCAGLGFATLALLGNHLADLTTQVSHSATIDPSAPNPSPSPTSGS